MDSNKNYIFHTYACHDDQSCEFSVELYDFSSELDSVGEPVKTITCFDELLTLLNEME